LTEGGPQEVAIELGTTSNLFQLGHRIRIDISGSSFPKLEPNPEAAHDVVYHDARHASCVDLSVR
jgi:predicted acyl esterase